MRACLRRKFSSDSGVEGWRKLTAPAYGAQPYNEWKLPKRLSQAIEQREDIQDGFLDAMREVMEKYELDKGKGGQPDIWRKMGEDISVADAAKEGHFRIRRKIYQQYLEQCYYGDLTYIKLYRPESEDEKERWEEAKKKVSEEEAEYRSKHDQFSNVILFGANYKSGYHLKNLYKALNVAKPDAIVLALRPEYLL